MPNPPKEIFKAYDIRGIVGQSLTAEFIQVIGHAIGSEAVARGQHTIAIGRDGRLSGVEFALALARGIQQSGINVIDVGRVATPMCARANSSRQRCQDSSRANTQCLR